jgi:hypothetical protein
MSVVECKAQFKATFKKVCTICVVALMVVWTGCGGGYSGGGGGGGGTNYAGQAQGVYTGTSSNGYSFESIVLPNDKIYGIYGTVSGNVFTVVGMVTGQGTSGNDTFTASTVTDFYYTGAVNTGSLTATDVPGSSINGTLTESGTSTTFSGTAPPSSSFNYNTPASVSDITGTWTGTLLDGTSTTVTINSNGSLSGSSSSCSFTGTVTADSSNKNFFDVSLTFGASCTSPNQTATGIAVYSLLPDGVTHELLAGVTAGTSFGTLFIADR